MHVAKFLSSVFAGLAVSVMITSCAGAVDKAEVEQKSNPVKEMHKEITATQEAEKNKLDWYSYEDGMAKARKEGKFVMIDFYTTWCKWCKKLDAETYKDPKVAAALKANFVTVKIDAESGNSVVHEMRKMTMSELAEKYGVSSYPAIWFVDKDGKKAKLLNGFLPPDSFLVYLDYIQSGKYKDMEFEEYVGKGAPGK